MSWEAELDGLKLDTAAFKVLSYLTFRGAPLKLATTSMFQ